MDKPPDTVIPEVTLRPPYTVNPPFTVMEPVSERSVEMVIDVAVDSAEVNTAVPVTVRLPDTDRVGMEVVPVELTVIPLATDSVDDTASEAIVT